MIKKIETLEAPMALGPYSQAVKVNGFLYVSGQLPIDSKTGQLVEGDIKVLTDRIIMNIKAILKEAGCTLEQVVQTSVFMVDLNEFKAMNEEYGRHFTGPIFPARQTIQVAALPMGAALEIACVCSVT